MHKSIHDILDSHELSKTMRQIAKETPGASDKDGTTIYYEAGYLASALARANQKILDLQRQIDEKEFEDSPFEDIKGKLEDMEDKLTQVWDRTC